jgi:hypothetical protein
MQVNLSFTKRNVSAICCTALLSLFSASSFALDSFQAVYTANVKDKLNFSGTLKRNLSKKADGQWLLKDNISSLFASIEESTVMNINGSKVQPLKYHYLRKVVGKKKKRDIDFDWSTKQATNRDNKKIALSANTQDPLSYQLQLQLDLKNGKRGKFSYNVAKKSSIDVMKFVEIGTEVIDTPMGKLKSIKLKLDRGSNAKRETYIWFSIKHNYIISKLHQIESDGDSYSLVLKKLS